jgi:hypothetical protein
VISAYRITSVVCLDKIEPKDWIRGLGCGHVYHKDCLDGWWERLHDFCPLCHRPIAPYKSKVEERKLHDAEDAINITTVV